MQFLPYNLKTYNMTISISNKYLINLKKYIWKLKVEKRKQKILNHQKITKLLNTICKKKVAFMTIVA